LAARPTWRRGGGAAAAQSKKRTDNWRLFQQDFSYEIGEIAELFDLHPNTVRQWLADGLPTIDDRRPTMVHGTDLIEFIRNRQSKRKRTCRPDEMFCCRCRAPQRPWENIVDIEIESDRRLRLKGLCSTCEAPLNRLGATPRLEEYRALFNVQTITDRRLVG
jgi:hypothetical protein